MAEESKSQASRVASEIAPAEESGTNFNDSGQEQGLGPGPGPYQTQLAGQKGGRCMCNPCKCCCRGNLRQACFVIAEVELSLGVFFLIIFIWNLVSPADKEEREKAAQQAEKAGVEVDSSPSIESTISEAILILLIILAGIALLLGVIKRSKVACLIHAGLAILVSLVHFAGVVLLIYILSVIGEYSDEKCKTVDPKSPDPDQLGILLCNLPPEIKTIVTVLLVLLLIFVFLVGALFAYFATNSIALYCHFKNGMTYEGTPVNGCCGGGRNQVQPQYQYQNQNYQYGQPQSQPEGQNQYQYQYQQQPQQTQQSEEPPPEYTSKTEVEDKPKPKTKTKSKGKSRASSNMSSSKKSPKKSKSKPEL